MKRIASKPLLKVVTRTVPIFLIEDNRARVKPELVLLDSALGDRDSARFVKEVRVACPEVKVIVMGLLPAHEDSWSSSRRASRDLS